MLHAEQMQEASQEFVGGESVPVRYGCRLGEINRVRGSRVGSLPGPSRTRRPFAKACAVVSTSFQVAGESELETSTERSDRRRPKGVRSEEESAMGCQKRSASFVHRLYRWQCLTASSSTFNSFTRLFRHKSTDIQHHSPPVCAGSSSTNFPCFIQRCYDCIRKRACRNESEPAIQHLSEETNL